MTGPRGHIGLDRPYFLFGTLMDADLLARVCGRPVAPRQIEPASIAGFRRTGVIGRGYPILVACPGARADGILVHGLGMIARRRLDVYEGPNYRLSTVAVASQAGKDIEAVAFLFVGALRSNRRHWRLADWQRRWKRRALRRAARLTDRRIRF